MASWIVNTAPVPASGVHEKEIMLLGSEPEPRLQLAPGTTLSWISHVQTSLVPLHLIAGQAVDCVSQDLRTRTWLADQFLTEEDAEEAPWWASGAAQAHVGILLRLEGDLVAWDGGPLITEVLLYATVIHDGVVSRQTLTPPPSSPGMEAGEAPYAIRIRALPLSKQPDFLDKVNQNPDHPNNNVNSNMEIMAPMPQTDTINPVDEPEIARPTLLSEQTASAHFADPVDGGSMPQDADAPAVRNKISLQRAVLTGMRMHGLQQRKRTRRTHPASIGEFAHSESLEDGTSYAQEEEFKNVYHHTYKAAAFALRREFAKEALRPEMMQDMVDRLLILFCDDSDPVGAKDINHQNTQTDVQ